LYDYYEKDPALLCKWPSSVWGREGGDSRQTKQKPLGLNEKDQLACAGWPSSVWVNE